MSTYRGEQTRKYSYCTFVSLPTQLRSYYILIMAGDGLVDLSLFAISPADDRHFAVLNETPPDGIYRSPRELGWPSSRRAALKPLPAVPTGRMCRRRPIRGRHDENSLCILERIKRMRAVDHAGIPSPTIQKRRSATTTSLLTLTVPAPRLHATATPQVTLSGPLEVTRDGSHSGSSMVWMPDEQMWLIRSEREQDVNHYFWGLHSPSDRPGRRYTRSEPSPDSNTHFDLSPLSPVRSQFLTLIDTSDQGRLTPLFQEAVQTVPLTDISPAAMPVSEYAPPSSLPLQPASNREPQEASLPDDSSEYESYHTASSFRMIRSSSQDEPRIVFPQLAWESSWEGTDIPDEGQGSMLVSTPPWQPHSDAELEREDRMPLVSPPWAHQSVDYPLEDSMQVSPQGVWQSPWGGSQPTSGDESAGVSSRTPISPPSVISSWRGI